MYILTRAGEYSDFCSESFGFDIFIIGGGAVFLCVFGCFGDFFRINCHLS
jgi:hypothetical protein